MRHRMKYVWCSLFVAACGPGQDRLDEIEGRVKQLEAQQAGQASVAALELQERCARQAEVLLKRYGIAEQRVLALTSDLGRGSLESHYSSAAGKCFVKVRIADTASGWVSSKVYDAFESTELAAFHWQVSTDKPLMCGVFPLGGPAKACNSEEEFERLIHVYMAK